MNIHEILIDYAQGKSVSVLALLRMKTQGRENAPGAANEQTLHAY